MRIHASVRQARLGIQYRSQYICPRHHTRTVELHVLLPHQITATLLFFQCIGQSDALQNKVQMPGIIWDEILQIKALIVTLHLLVVLHLSVIIFLCFVMSPPGSVRNPTSLPPLHS